MQLLYGFIGNDGQMDKTVYLVDICLLIRYVSMSINNAICEIVCGMKDICGHT